jgi:hypothetical protein
MRLCSATTSNRWENLVLLLETARTKIAANSGHGFAEAAIALAGTISMRLAEAPLGRSVPAS